MERKQHLETLNYSGIFLSCYSNDNTSCVHANRDHSLTYLFSGEYRIDDNETQTIIQPGECVFIKRDHRTTMHKKPTDTEQYKGITLIFKRSLLREIYNTRLNKNELPENIITSNNSIFRIQTTPDITSLFQSLTPYFDSGIQPSDEIAKLKLEEGIYSLLNIDKQFYSILFDFTEPWKIDILKFMDENYMYDLSMEDIAIYTGRSLATFKRDFAKISDITPQKWLINKRLLVAHDKLINEHKKASDVYVEVGFKNLSHFYSAYKKQFGYSPAIKHLT